MLPEEFLRPSGITQSAMAAHLGISFPVLNEIIRDKRGVTPDTASRLARVVRMSADFCWGFSRIGIDGTRCTHSTGATEIAHLKPLSQSV